MNKDELYHHGILGQKWGVRRFQNATGGLTAAGKKRYGIVESPEEREANHKKLYSMTDSGKTDALRRQALKNKAMGKTATPSKGQLKKEAKRVGKMYKEELNKGYINSGDKLEKYTGKKYYDLIDSIESSAAKQAASRYVKEYGKLHVNQLENAKGDGGRVAYWLKQG